MQHHPFEAEVANDWPPSRWLRHRVVVAVSGGADSVALLRSLVTLTRTHLDLNMFHKTLVVAHFHHGWRGESADLDQQFVASLAETLELRFSTAHSCRKWRAGGIGREATARHERYRFLLNTAEQHGARYVVTAHTADDQVETVLHRILRGTGIDGMAGIPRVRRLSTDVALVRPLLRRTRAEIEDYLADLGQAFRTDETNADQSFTRNRVRHQLIPGLREQFQPDLTEAIQRLSEDARDHMQAVRREMDAHYDRIIALDGPSITIKRQPFERLSPLTQRLLLRELWRRNHWPQQSMSRRQWHQLAQFIATAVKTKRHFPGGVLATVEEHEVHLSRKPAASRRG